MNNLLIDESKVFDAYVLVDQLSRLNNVDTIQSIAQMATKLLKDALEESTVHAVKNRIDGCES